MTLSLHNLWSRLHPFRTPLLVAALAWALFLLPAQTSELYLLVRDDVGLLVSSMDNSASMAATITTRQLWQLVAFSVTLCLLTVTLAICSIELARQSCRTEAGLRPQMSFVPYLLALAVALAPLAAVAFGFYRVAGSATSQISAKVDYVIWMVLAGIAVGVAGWWLLIIARSSNRGSAMLSTGSAVLIAACVLAVTVVLSVGTVEISQYVGTLAVVCCFLACLAIITSATTAIYVRSGIPLFGLLVLIAIVFAQFGLNDNHRVTHRISPGSPPNLENSFIDWARARRDKEAYAQNGIPYPIYFVAAEGGGLYAGYHAASFLASMQDDCPSFAQHVFAISSVSGGSLGAGLFAALTRKEASNDPWQPCVGATSGKLSQAVQDYFSTDFLAALVTAALFPDFVQRFLPFAFPTLDRAKALERSFALAWTSKVDRGGQSTNPFESPLHSLWDPTGATPALIVNTTSLPTGSRVSFSPIDFGQTPSATHVSRALTCNRAGSRIVDVSLATAVSLSARFPWLAPTGWLERSEEGRRDFDLFGGRAMLPQAPVRVAQLQNGETGAPGWSHQIAQGENVLACTGGDAEYGKRLILADGGYYENSGLETLVEIVARVERIVEVQQDLFPNGVALKTIVIFSRDAFASRWWSQSGVLSNSGANEFLAPTELLLNTRRARARAVHTRAQIYDGAFYQPDTSYFRGVDIERSGGLETRIENAKVYNVLLEGISPPLPLGWHLSQSVMARIRASASAESQRSARLIRRDLSMSH